MEHTPVGFGTRLLLTFGSRRPLVGCLLRLPFRPRARAARARLEVRPDCARALAVYLPHCSTTLPKPSNQQHQLYPVTESRHATLAQVVCRRTRGDGQRLMCNTLGLGNCSRCIVAGQD